VVVIKSGRDTSGLLFLIPGLVALILLVCSFQHPASREFFRSC
jgi:hypothetical protein